MQKRNWRLMLARVWARWAREEEHIWHRWMLAHSPVYARFYEIAVALEPDDPELWTQWEVFPPYGAVDFGVWYRLDVSSQPPRWLRWLFAPVRWGRRWLCYGHWLLAELAFWLRWGWLPEDESGLWLDCSRR